VQLETVILSLSSAVFHAPINVLKCS